MVEPNRKLKRVFVLLMLIGGCTSSIKKEVDIHIRQQDWTKAKEILEQARTGNPGDGETLILLARVYGELGEYEKMSQILTDSALKGYTYQKEVNYLTEKHWRENFNRGIECAEKKDLRKAVEYLKNAVVIAPLKEEPYRLLGDFWVQLQSPNEAIEAYEKYVEFNKKDGFTCDNLSELLYRAGNMDKAIHYSRETLRRIPLQLSAQTRIAYCCMALDRNEEAENAFESALRMGETVELCEEYGKLCFTNKNYELAKNLFIKPLTLLYADPKACNRFYKYIAECSMGLENYRDVAVYYEKYLVDSPNDRDALNSLLFAYDQLGDKKNRSRIIGRLEKN
jgi:tetratricopeptide (TPR) repeat protein